jgi:hypothetical protein
MEHGCIVVCRMVFLSAFLVGWVQSSGGQNLVPNPGFEQYDTCPSNFGQWIYVTDWDSPYTMSADYFNGCAGGSICGYPLNHFGYQYPAEGEAYMGLATFGHASPFYREILTTELIDPLQVGVPVYVSFAASCGGFGSWPYNSARWKARGPGVKFFVDLPVDWFDYLYPNSAAVGMTAVLSDTASWQTIGGWYTPDSAYRYIAIANFFEDSLSWPSVLDTNGLWSQAYAFIDQVCVSSDASYCISGELVPELDGVYPQVVQVPFVDALTLVRENPYAFSEVVLFNSLGQAIASRYWPAGMATLTIPAVHLPNGAYSVWVTSQFGTWRSGMLPHVNP